MFERVKTKKNQNALKYSGRWLCSSVDAKAEAEKWYTDNSRILQSQQLIVVLGGGCGYHLVEIMKHQPNAKLLVIDAAVEALQFITSEHSLQLADMKMLPLQSLDLLAANPLVKKFVQNKAAIVTYKPAWITSPAAYDEAHMFLTARTEAGLKYLIEQRSDLRADIQTIHDTIHGYVSIKTLESSVTLKVDSQLSQIMRVLRELVA